MCSGFYAVCVQGLGGVVGSDGGWLGGMVRRVMSEAGKRGGKLCQVALTSGTFMWTWEVTSER